MEAAEGDGVMGTPYNMRPWSDEEISRLKTLRDSRMTWLEISRVMGRGKETIRNKYTEQFGYSVRAEGWTEEEEGILREGVINGLTFRELSEKIGRPYGAVKDKSYRMGLVENRIGTRSHHHHMKAAAPIRPDDALYKRQCARGSRKLLIAYMNYFEKYHPENFAAAKALVV